MASADLVAWRTAYVATPEPVAGEDTFFAMHREMNQMLDRAGIGISAGVRFQTPDFSPLAAIWSAGEVRLTCRVVSKSWHGEGG